VHHCNCSEATPYFGLPLSETKRIGIHRAERNAGSNVAKTPELEPEIYSLG
jgi:hypothetical protein